MSQKEIILDRWRKKLFYICVLLAAIGTVCEIVIYLADSTFGELALPDRLYRFRFIYIPSTANLLVIVMTYFGITSNKLSSSAKNVWSSVLIFFLCANMQVLHYVYGSLATLPVIAIMISAIFANKRLTLWLTIASSATLAVNAVCAVTEFRKDDPWLPAEIVLAFTVIWVSYITARLLTSFVAEQIDAVVTGRQRENKLIEETNLDGLTGIGNRKALTSFLNRLTNDGLLDENSYLCMLDIDHFKKINDTYGHPCGDEVIIALSKLLKNHSEEGISAFRYGGDEIIIILQNYTKEKSISFAHQLSDEFVQLSFASMPDTHFSFSAGIAAYKEGMSSRDWIKAADTLLYAVKVSGRGQINMEH